MTKRSYLFIHQNMPGQFLHLCRYLRDRGDRVVFITRNKLNQLQGVTKVIYDPSRDHRSNQHPYLVSTENAVLFGQSVLRSIIKLKEQNFKPDIVIGHSGWGEMLFIKDILPQTPVLSYFEFYYNSFGQDLGFDPEYPSNLDSMLSSRVKNAVHLLSAEVSDRGLTPTQWQFNTHPLGTQAKTSIIHEGVDTNAIRPDTGAMFTTESGKELRAGQKTVTFVARNLEPYRGFHTFMRALPAIQRQHPDAEILIVGADGVSYGAKLPEGESYKKRMIEQVEFDRKTVHFTGHLDTARFRSVMHVSMVHVYLTYPFVLSWSLLEAMASECLIVGSRTAPVEEVISHGQNGILVDFFDHNKLAEQIGMALERPESFTELRKAARKTVVAKYDLHSMCLPRQLGLVDSMIKRR